MAESLWLEGTQVNQAIRTGIDTNQLRELAMQEGMRTLHQEALALRAAGITSDAELIRVFGLNFDEDN